MSRDSHCKQCWLQNIPNSNTHHTFQESRTFQAVKNLKIHPQLCKHHMPNTLWGFLSWPIFQPMHTIWIRAFASGCVYRQHRVHILTRAVRKKWHFWLLQQGCFQTVAEKNAGYQYIVSIMYNYSKVAGVISSVILCTTNDLLVFFDIWTVLYWLLPFVHICMGTELAANYFQTM